MQIKSAQSAQEIEQCVEVMSELRPHLNKENIVAIISGMIKRGYHLLFIEENGKAVCASGYRFSEHLAWGQVIYIDDLSTLTQHRGKGYAGKMLDHISSIAKEKGCDAVHLDSGTNPARYNAHRLYLGKGFNITSYHFVLTLK